MKRSQRFKRSGEVKFETKRALAAKVFRHTAAYDAMIAGYMTELVGLETSGKIDGYI